jgi:hypothetical protein
VRRAERERPNRVSVLSPTRLPLLAEFGRRSTADSATASPRTHELFQCGQNHPTPRVAQNHKERRAEALCGELNVADLRGSDDVSSNADDKQVAQTLVEDDFCRYS